MKKQYKKLNIIILIAIICLAMAACGTSGGDNAPDPLAGFTASDMSGYEGLAGYEGELPFVDVTVADIHKMKEAGETFAVFFSYKDCPWCNAVIKEFTDAANEARAKVASIDTRKNPAWASNLDIDDYDVFVEDFGDYLEYDSNGIKHLYVPHVFFIKDGEVVSEHQGAIPSMGDDPYMQLTDEQRAELKKIYTDGFAAMK